MQICNPQSRFKSMLSKNIETSLRIYSTGVAWAGKNNKRHTPTRTMRRRIFAFTPFIPVSCVQLFPESNIGYRTGGSLGAHIHARDVSLSNFSPAPLTRNKHSHTAPARPPALPAPRRCNFAMCNSKMRAPMRYHRATRFSLPPKYSSQTSDSQTAPPQELHFVRNIFQYPLVISGQISFA